MTDAEYKKSCQDLMIVYAIEGYANKHKMPSLDTYSLLMRSQVPGLIRKHYGALHTQDMDENIDFAEDIVRQG
jgi:hypothetical protein